MLGDIDRDLELLANDIRDMPLSLAVSNFAYAAGELRRQLERAASEHLWADDHARTVRALARCPVPVLPSAIPAPAARHPNT